MRGSVCVGLNDWRQSSCRWHSVCLGSCTSMRWLDVVSRRWFIIKGREREERKLSKPWAEFLLLPGIKGQKQTLPQHHLRGFWYRRGCLCVHLNVYVCVGGVYLSYHPEVLTPVWCAEDLRSESGRTWGGGRRRYSGVAALVMTGLHSNWCLQIQPGPFTHKHRRMLYENTQSCKCKLWEPHRVWAPHWTWWLMEGNTLSMSLERDGQLVKWDLDWSSAQRLKRKIIKKKLWYHLM